MALNLAIHKATITDDGGTVTATQANMNGIHDEDESTNVVEVATNNTLYLHYDLGAAYQITQLRIYASTINTAYWLVQCSNNDADWTTESLATTGSYVYSNIDDGYRYLRIRCDTTGRTAISLREHIIDADATLMKYQCGSSDQIGSSTDSGSYYGDPSAGGVTVIDYENPASADGYLVAVTFGKQEGSPKMIRVYIFREVGDNYVVIDGVEIPDYKMVANSSDPIVLDPPLKFKAGDFLAVNGEWSGAWYYPEWRGAAVVGKSIKWKAASSGHTVGDSIAKSSCTTISDRELRLHAESHIDLPTVYVNIPIPDRFLTGLPGDSTNPRVVNEDVYEGLTPDIDFYGVVSTLASGISDSDTSLTLHKASDFPQASAGAAYGGRLLIGTEKIDYTYISSNTIYGLTRGVDGSSPAGYSAWDIVKDITRWVEISVDDSTWKKPSDAGLPLSFGATIAVGASKTFYVRANVVYEYQDDKQIYSRVHVLWAV